MEAIAAFFAFGSVWYFLFSGLWIILLFYWVEKEHIFLSGLNIVIYALFLNFIVKKDVFGNIIGHPTETFVILAGYFVLGFGWSFVKWWLLVNKAALKYKEERKDWLKRQTHDHNQAPELKNVEITIDTPVPQHLIEDWKRYSCFKTPKVLDHKMTISHWVLYWPVSALWSLLDDFIGKVTRVIIVKIRFAYEGVTKSAFKDTEEFK